MTINPDIFRAYDIRGIAETDIPDEVAEALGKAYGTYIQQIAGPNIVVGRDVRLSSPRIHAAFVRGALSTGCHVHDAGLTTTPMIYFAIWHLGLDGGINITASHNPKEYNGFKVCKQEAQPIYGDELTTLLHLIQDEQYTSGHGEVIDLDIYPDYRRTITERVQLTQRFKVVLDTGNGVAGLTAPTILRDLGIDLVTLYSEPDGNFPHHTPDPEDEHNLTDLKAKVLEVQADLGIGIDGDGDRIGVVDRHGVYHHADTVLAILARDLLVRHPGATVLCDVKSSSTVLADIETHGGIGRLFQTGHSHFKNEMRQNPNVWLGGEVSGHIFMRENWFGFDDATYVSARLLQAVEQLGGSFDTQISSLPQTVTTPEIKLSCSDSSKFAVIAALTKKFQEHYDVITVDGARVQFPDNAWGLVRASNTSPYLTLRFEARTQLEIDQMMQLFDIQLRQFPEVTGTLLPHS